VQDALDLKESLEPLSIPEWTPGEVYAYLIPYNEEAIRAAMIACDSAMVRERLEVFLSRLRHVRPSLSGEELKRMAVLRARRSSRCWTTCWKPGWKAR